ncbi:hypothetical protein KR038_011683 [Drosophila bunnanda]|nr:hypothetical protein KR038_011683 [Drosophila bunnanda]
MANLDETFEKPEFDWSAISVGDYKLDHSQNFFGESNKENNRNLNNENHQELIFSNCATPRLSKFRAVEEPPEDKVIVDENETKVAQEAMTRLKLAEITSNSPPKTSPATEPEPAPASGSSAQLEKQKQTFAMNENETKADQGAMYDDIENMPEAEAARVTRGNLRMQWSPIRHEHEGAGAGTAAASAPVPKAYAFKDLYECNRQQARRRQEEEDRQARQFHSRPMPNFKAMHKRIDDMVVVHRITVPRTPQTVKYWQSCVERRRQAKSDQDKEEQRQPSLEPVHPQPRHRTFNLHSDQRVRDRRDFDSAVQERQVQKKKEVNK